jgi:hypothetical protein
MNLYLNYAKAICGRVEESKPLPVRTWWSESRVPVVWRGTFGAEPKSMRRAGPAEAENKNRSGVSFKNVLHDWFV